MKTTWKRRAFALGSLFLFPMAAPDALANGHFARDVVYMAPTDYVTTLATSWYLPTVSVVPTYYTTSYVPRSYVAASYVVRPSAYAYVPTYYRESYALFPRLARRRAFLPTAYVYPSTRAVETVYSTVSPTSYFDVAVETTSSECCSSVPVCETPGDDASYGAPAPETIVTEPSRTETVRTVPRAAPPRRVESGTTTAAPLRSSVADPKRPPAMPAPPLGVDERRPKPVDPKAATPEIDLGSPPASPAPDVETPSGNPLANPTELTPPVAPVDPAPKNPPGTVYQRDAFRPVFTAVNATTYLRSSRDGSLHVLEGKVVSSLTHEAESGVRVTVSNRRQTFADRVAVTDGNGRYKVRLPDGDWTVSVTTKSGKVYPVSELIVDKGQISDDAGETIPSLTITR